MSALSDLQDSVTALVKKVDDHLAADATGTAALVAQNTALQAQVTDLTSQLSAFANDAQAMADMKAQLDAEAAKL